MKNRGYSKAAKRALRALPVVLAVGGLALGAPSAVMALAGGSAPALIAPANDFSVFTPSQVDPQLARRVTARLQSMGQSMPFTPAGSRVNQDKTVTVAVRIDDQKAHAIAVRGAIRSAANKAQTNSVGRIAIAPSSYNLGISRGYQSFAKPVVESPVVKKPVLAGVNRVQMPDLANFKPAAPTAPEKPSRLKSRIAIEKNTLEGRSPGTLEAKGDPSVDLSGAYSITRNFDVKAGVRISQERDRNAPLADSVQDNQAVYVGTQFRF